MNLDISVKDCMGLIRSKLQDLNLSDEKQIDELVTLLTSLRTEVVLQKTGGK